MLPSPLIIFPTNGANYSTDTPNQVLSGTTIIGTNKIYVNGSSFGVVFTPGTTVWSWSGILTLGLNTYSITAIDQNNVPSIPTIITINFIQPTSFVTVSSPTGIKLREYQTSIDIINAQNNEPNVIGYNYYVSTQSGGINGSYTLINTQTVTEISFQEEKTKLLNKVSDTANNIRTTTLTEEISTIQYYSTSFTQAIFNNMVVSGTLPAVVWSQNTPFFFVITSVVYDSVLGEVSESAYSAELQGSPITIVSGLVTLPTRSQSDIFTTISTELLNDNTGIDTKPGTVVNDEIIPITEEMARLYIIQDFLSRSLSISSLLNFDDVNGTGLSDPVTTSILKQNLQLSLNLTNPADVQSIIDTQFDKLAANVNIVRRGATYATGQVVFYTPTPPIRSMTVDQGAIITSTGNLDQGIAAQNFIVLAAQTLDYNTASQYYNPTTQQYELTCDVQATVAGSAGNVDSYSITTIASGVDANFSIENPNPIMFGQDLESNQELAVRTQLAFFVDTGTAGGYLKTALDVIGVQNANVVKAGDPLMIRDYDPVSNEHLGGKVDVYIQGELLTQITDNIAFSYQSIAGTNGQQLGETFLVLSATTFEFESTNPRVTASTPILPANNNASLSGVSKVYNATRGANYDITGYQIISGNIIQLQTNYTNTTIGLASNDVILVDYRFRSSDTYVLSHQPVNNIVSVVGQLSGVLSSANWALVKLQDPLNTGGSTISQDSIQIIYANGLPVNNFQTISNEPHVILLSIPVNLNYIGADPNSIIVTNSNDSTTYLENIDYRVLLGTDITPTSIEMIETGSLINGQSILITYTAIENFAVTYTTNGLLDTVQTELDITKHACADVIAKEAIENNVDFVFTVVPKTTVNNQQNMTAQIQTAVANYVAQLGLGKNLSQSSVVSIIQQIPNVAYVVLPFLRMVKADGSFISRDDIGKTQFEIFNEGIVTSYISTVPVLEFSTINQGGPPNLFKGIFENTEALVLQDDELSVSNGPGNGYIRADGRIVVSTIEGNLPNYNDYQISYWVYGETGSKDIIVTSLEYLSVGNFVVQYDTPIN